jgi:hypothetical protein
MQVRRTVLACTATAVVPVNCAHRPPGPAAMEPVASPAWMPLIVYRARSSARTSCSASPELDDALARPVQTNYLIDYDEPARKRA